MKAFLIAGTNSGSGKTTLTLGVLKALARRGLRVQPFKVGPDYIDTAWHTQVSGVPSRNLDAFMVAEKQLFHSFYYHTAQADIAVVEGVMGLYDGFGSDPFYCSSAGIAKALDCPVILVVDGHAVSTSAAATVLGFQQFGPGVTIAGVILNQVTSDSHFQLIKQAIEHYCHIPVLGRLPKLNTIALPSRHLGLVTAEEWNTDDTVWKQLADAVEQFIDLDALLKIATIVPPAPIVSDVPAGLLDAGQGLTIALAYDQAFNFYYQDNLDFLVATGAKIVRFSPLHDTSLPDADLIYIGGGFPELHADALATNQLMRSSVRQAHDQAIPIYAECGGLMYLGDSLEDMQGQQFPMCGIIPGRSMMTASLQRFGYCEATANADLLLMPAGGSVKGHEFHYSDFVTDLPPVFSLCKHRNGKMVQEWQGGYQVGNTLASYLHVHFGQNPALILHWFEQARSVQ